MPGAAGLGRRAQTPQPTALPLQGPTDRQQLIIELVAQGLTNREIAESLGTSDTAVKNYVREIFLKVGVRSRLELALWYEEQVHQGKSVADESPSVPM